MARKQPSNIAPPDFGAEQSTQSAFAVSAAVMPDEAPCSVDELLSAQPIQAAEAKSEPEAIAALRETVKTADKQRGQDNATEATDSPVVSEPAAAVCFQQFRVSIEGVRPRVVDPIREVGEHQDYLDVWGRTPWEALEAFAEYNGIPIARDPLTMQKKLATIHNPKAEALAFDAKRSCYCKIALRGELTEFQAARPKGRTRK